MTIEERIARIEKAMRFEQEQFEWLQANQWGHSDDGHIQLRKNWNAAILAHDRVLAAYQQILDDLKSR